MNPMPVALPKSTNLRTPPGIIATIIAVSAAASVLICWLVYFHAPTDVAHTQLRSLPLVNAVLNGLATIALVTGYHEIRQRRVLHHRASMFAAFFFSSIFLVSYLVNFTLHGETHLPIAHTGLLWNTYAFVLFGTHIPLAIVALPMILITFFFSLTGRFPAHKKIARWTFPIWLYVSVSGVFVYFLQAVIHP
jgi:putative membrane protein